VSNLHGMSTLETECISFEKDARVSLSYPNPETTRAIHNAAGGILRDCIDIKIRGKRSYRYKRVQ